MATQCIPITSKTTWRNKKSCWLQSTSGKDMYDQNKEFLWIFQSSGSHHIKTDHQEKGNDFKVKYNSFHGVFFFFFPNVDPKALNGEDNYQCIHICLAYNLV